MRLLGKSGPIEMVSNMTLYTAAGATIKFPATKMPFIPGRQQGIEALTPIPLIGGHDLQNVAVEGAFSIQHSTNLELNDVSNRKPLLNTPVLRLESSPGAIVRNCRAFPGTDIFLSASRDEAKSFHLVGNVLDNAHQAEQATSAAQ